jgi:K+-transporting ATPase ATPase A chain
MVRDTRQGWALLSVMAGLWAVMTTLVVTAELTARGTVPQLVGASFEGKEQRLGVWLSAIFATSTTGTSTGSVNSFHDSYTALGGGTLILNMLYGEVAPGGVGAGLYGLLVLAVIAVFLGGLMVGRTPEYLGKKLGRREVTLAALAVLAMPFAVLVGTGLALAYPPARETILNPGAHGLSEVLYAYTSASNNNGSAFAGLGVATPFYNTTLGLAMLLGRFVPIVLVLALAGSLARQQPVPVTAGTLPTHRPLFVSLLTGTVVVVAGLTFFPALALGPLAEGLL